MPDQKLEELVSEYADLAKDKNIDATALLINALQQQGQNNISGKTKKWAYLISIGLPPLGLIFVVLFYFSDYDDGESAAITCLVLTVIASVVGFVLIKATLSGSGVSTEQLQQIKPRDVYELAQ